MGKKVKQQSWPRRRFIAAGAALALCGGLSHKASAAVSSGERVLSFYNLHTGESFRQPYRSGESYLEPALSEINVLLRDFRTGEVKKIDPHLLDYLYRLRGLMGGEGTFQVISGYRSPKTNALLAKKSGGVAKKSFHMKGMAIDVRLQGRDLAKLHKAALSLRLGGVGFYPESDFVHLDTGRVRSW